MPFIFAVLFLSTLAATVAGYGLGRYTTGDDRRRLRLLSCRLHRASRALRAAVAAHRLPVRR